MNILILIVVLAFAAILILAATKPKHFSIERRITVQATPEKVEPLVEDFHQWEHWSPWAKLDPNMDVTFSGADKGVGAVYEWLGDKKVGQGRMEITAASTNLVEVKLDFIKPFAANNITEFHFTPVGDSATEVRWYMHGPSPFISRVFGVFMNMDKMIGKDFEKGLADLKRKAESQ